MKTFSKVIAFIGMIAILFSLVGCGKKGGDDTPKVPTKLIAKYSDGTEVTSLNLEVGESKTIEFSTDLKDHRLTISKLKNVGEPTHVSCDKQNLSFTITGLTATGEQPENLVFTYKVDAKKTLTLTIPVTVYEYEPTELIASSTEETLRIGEVKVIALTTNPENRPLPEDAVVGWTSSNLEIASVEDGTVTGVAAGEATITATYKGLTATVNVTVKDSVAESLEAVIEPTSVKEGEKANITLKVKYDDADSPQELKPNANVSFEADKDVVSIDENGVVTAKEVAAKTTVKITVTYTYKEGATPVSDDVELEIVPIVVDSLIAAIDQESLKEGETANISLKVKYDDGTESVITSDEVEIVADNDAVTIEDGVVTANKVDEETIVNITVTYTYKERDYTDELSVTVFPYVATALVASAENEELQLSGEDVVTTTITLTTEPDSKPLAASEAVFTVEEGDAVEVSEEGVVTAVKPGTAIVTVTYGTLTSEIVFTVEADPNVAIEWPITNVTTEGSGVYIYLDNTNLGLVPSFEDENEATSAVAVDANGDDITIENCFYQSETTLYVSTLGAHSNMTLTITGKIAGQNYKSVIKIVNGQWDDPNYVPTGLLATPSEVNLAPEGTQKITLKTNPNNKALPADAVVTWETENGAIATVSSDGVITGVAEGNTTVTATYEYKEGENLVATIPVNVLSLEELPLYTVNLNTAGGGAWMYIDVIARDDADPIPVKNESIYDIELVGMASQDYVGVASSIKDGKGVRFGYGFADATFQAGDHTLKFKIRTENGTAYEFVVEFTGKTGQDQDMTINSQTCKLAELVPAIKLSSNLVLADGEAVELPLEVTDIPTFNADNLTVTSSAEEVATVAVVEGKILVTGSTAGTTTITATYTDVENDVDVSDALELKVKAELTNLISTLTIDGESIAPTATYKHKLKATTGEWDQQVTFFPDDVCDGKVKAGDTIRVKVTVTSTANISVFFKTEFNGNSYLGIDSGTAIPLVAGEEKTLTVEGVVSGDKNDVKILLAIRDAGGVDESNDELTISNITLYNLSE